MAAAPRFGLTLWVTASLLATASACIDSDKVEPQKGQVDTSSPPGTPEGSSLGKADSADRLVPLSVESAHPYDNDTDHTETIDLGAALPWCASEVQLHFASLRTELGYDRVTVSNPAGQSQTFEGHRDDTWTEWFTIDPADKRLLVQLHSDYSITDHGYAVDQARWQGTAVCPAVVWPPCEAGTVDINPPPGLCGCPQQPTCVATADIEIQRQVYRGFNNSGKVVRGHDAFTSQPGPADGLVETGVGTVSEQALLALVRDAAQAGVLHAPGYDQFGEWTEYFRIRTGDHEVVFRAELGGHDPEVQVIIDRFLALFDCDASDEPMTCGTGYACNEGECVEFMCMCTAEYDPVCGVDRQTYSNDGCADCAGVAILHPGECGTDGDMCGGFAGWPCAPGYECFGMADYPDAAGTCRPEGYCEAVSDCLARPTPIGDGQWACESNQCSWSEQVSWNDLPGWSFATAHPYANNANQWQELYLPAGATALRLSAASFDLEQGYDFLEVWSWSGGQWRLAHRYTGSDGPREDEYPGRYHYLHFVSDYSVTRWGFLLSAEWR